jgi:flavodoxin
MKCLIAYYSRTGTARKVARTVMSTIGQQTSFKCDLEELIDPTNRAGTAGYKLSYQESTEKKQVPIRPTQHDPSSYDLVILGGPVWAYTVASALRTYMVQNAGKVKNAAFFCTYDFSGNKTTLQDMQELAGKPPIATFYTTTKEVVKGKHITTVQNFVSALDQGMKVSAS